MRRVLLMSACGMSQLTVLEGEMSFLRQAYILETYGMRLTMDQVADAIGLATNTVYNKIAQGKFKIPTYLDDGKRWADFSAVAAYLDDLAKSADCEATQA